MAESRTAAFLRVWMLPLALVLGISLRLLVGLLPISEDGAETLHTLVSEVQRWGIAVLLLCQFVKISPHQMCLRRWHLWLLLFQVGFFLALALLARALVPGTSPRILTECAMLCLICPTASAAGVITEKLGGNLAETVSYLVLINLVGTLLIPSIIPMVSPSAELSFWAYVFRIAMKIFPVLLLPALVAWTIRYTLPRLQRRLMRWAGASFYVWGVTLTLAMTLATHALLESHLGIWALSGIVAVSLLCCMIQYVFGRKAGKGVTSAQTLGQKNTGFLIWLGYTYLTPVTSVAGGLYAIWQNLFNSWELYRSGKKLSNPEKSG